MQFIPNREAYPYCLSKPILYHPYALLGGEASPPPIAQGVSRHTGQMGSIPLAIGITALCDRGEASLQSNTYNITLRIQPCQLGKHISTTYS